MNSKERVEAAAAAESEMSTLQAQKDVMLNAARRAYVAGDDSGGSAVPLNEWIRGRREEIG